MSFTLDTWSIETLSGHLPVSAADPLLGSIADFKRLELNYTMNSGSFIGDFWFNPGLFVEDGQTLVAAGTLPDVGYYLSIPDSGAQAAREMFPKFSGNSPALAASKNWSATVEKTANNAFTVRFDFYLTTDLAGWFGQVATPSNIDRFLKSSRFEGDQLVNQVNSVYFNGSNIGVLIALERAGEETTEVTLSAPSKAGSDGIFYNEYEAPSAYFAVITLTYNAPDKIELIRGNTYNATQGLGSPVVASSGTSAGNNDGSVDSFDGPSGAGVGYTLGAAPTPPAVPAPNFWYLGFGLARPSRRTEYIAATGDNNVPSLNNAEQITWCETTPGEIITVRVSGTSDTLWDFIPYAPPRVSTTQFGPENLHSFLPADYSFINEDTENETFNLTRSGNAVTNLSTASATDVNILIDYAGGTFNQIRYSLLNISNGNNQTDFITNYGADFQDAPVPTGGPTFETDISIPTSDVATGGRYRIICIGYDTANETSKTWLSPVFTVTGVDFCLPTVTSEIDNYVETYPTDYLELSALQRIECKLEIVESCTPVTQITVNFEGEQIIATLSGGSWSSNDARFAVTGTGTVNTVLSLQIPESWANSDVLITYSLQLDNQVRNTYHRLKIRQNEEDAGGATLSNTELFDSLGVPVEDFCALSDGDLITLRTTKADPDGFRQIAVHTDGSISESDPFVGILPTVTDTGFSSVDVNFTANEAEYVFSPAVYSSGKIGIVAFKDQSEAEISFSFRENALNPDFTVTGPLSNVSFKYGIPLTLTSLDFNFQINGGSVLTFAQFQAQSGSLINGDIVTAICTDLSAIDTSLVITYSAAGDTGTSNIPILLSDISNDCLIPLKRAVTLNSVSAASGANVIGAIRLDGPDAVDYTAGFALMNVAGIAAIQSIIDGLPADTEYRLHFNVRMTTASTILIVNFTDQ